MMPTLPGVSTIQGLSQSTVYCLRYSLSAVSGIGGPRKRKFVRIETTSLSNPRIPTLHVHEDKAIQVLGSASWQINLPYTGVVVSLVQPQ